MSTGGSKSGDSASISTGKRPTITLIIPTIGRPTLARALRSVRDQEWIAGDEVLLVGDGHVPSAASLWDQFSLPGRYLEVPGPSKDWGHTPRNLIMSEAKAEYIAALDDDDELATGAIATIRAALSRNPGRPHMFRMDGDPIVGTVWKTREVKLRNVGTPMFVLPTHGPRAKYLPVHGGDHAFMWDTLAMWPPNSLVWREEIICHVRPRDPAPPA